jgi:hypothetical protein
VRLAAHPPPQLVDPLLQLRDAALADRGPAAHAPELGVHEPVRLAVELRAHADEAVEELPLLLERAVQRDVVGILGGPALGLLALALGRVLRLPVLPLGEELAHLLGLEDPGEPDELLLLEAADVGPLSLRFASPIMASSGL